MIANNENKQTNRNNEHLGHVNYKCVKNNVNSKEFISDIRGTAPLYLRTLRRYTNAVIIIIIKSTVIMDPSPPFLAQLAELIV